MALSISKISSLNEVEQQKNEYSKQVYFSANRNDALAEDKFEKKNKKKKAVKIAGWTLAVATAIVVAVLYKKGNALEKAGKNLGDAVPERASEIVDGVDGSLAGRIKDGSGELAGQCRRAEENASDVEIPTHPRTTKVEPTEPPTVAPTSLPTPIPTAAPSRVEPTASPSPIPTAAPSRIEPTATPSPIPTSAPTSIPTLPSRVEPTVVPVKVEPRIFTEDEAKAAVNARLDRTVPVIPEELKTFTPEHPDFKANFKEIFGMDLSEIESIPLDKYKYNGNFVYEEILPDGRELIVTRLHDNSDVIQGIDIFQPNEYGMYIKKYWVGFGKSEIIMGDMPKHITTHYNTDGTINTILVGRESLGTYTYDAQCKLFRILEEDNPKTMTQRRIYLDPQTGKIKTIQYFDTTRGGWEGMKADYFDNNGEFSREIFSDDALRIARKKEEIKEKIKFDRKIPDIPDVLKTITIKYPRIKDFFDEVGIDIEEIKRIPVAEYKPWKTSEVRYVKELPGGKKLTVCRYKEDVRKLAYMFFEGPQGVEKRIIFGESGQNPFIIQDFVNKRFYWYLDDKLVQIDLHGTVLGNCTYNAKGKLERIFNENPETNIIKDIAVNVETGKIESITYKENVSSYLKYECLNADGEIKAEYFPEDL